MNIQFYWLVFFSQKKINVSSGFIKLLKFLSEIWIFCKMYFLINSNIYLIIVKLLSNIYLITVHARVLSRLSHVWLFATLWTVARQAPLSIGFSRQEYWSGLPCPLWGGLPDLRIEPTSVPPALQAGFLTTVPPRNPFICQKCSWRNCDVIQVGWLLLLVIDMLYIFN